MGKTNINITKTLLIEDDESHVEIITTLLEGSNLIKTSIDIACDLKKARQLIQDNKYDLVFSDLSLPDSNYNETLEKLVEIVNGTPIVVLTSLDDEETINGLIKAGANDCIPKSQLNTAVLERAVIYNLDRYNREQVIKQSEEKFRKITTSISDSIITIDGESIITFWNDAAEKTFGYTSAEIIGKSMEMIFPVEFVTDYQKNM